MGTTKKRKKSGPEVVRGRPSRRRGSKAKWFLLAGGGAFVMGIIIYSFFAAGLLGSASEPNNVTAEAAPDVILATADGEFRLSEQRGKVLVLYFSFPG